MWEVLPARDHALRLPGAPSTRYRPERQLQGEENRWLRNLQNDFFDLILFDEAHHNVAESWDILRHAFPAARIVNYSATPTRADGQLMAGRIVYAHPVAEAIRQGYVKSLKAVVLNPRTLRYVRREGDQEIEVSLEEVIRLGEDDADFRRSIVTSTETLNTIVDASIRELPPLLRMAHGEARVSGPNPAVDLRAYMGKAESKRQRRSKPYQHFSPTQTDLVLDVARNHHRRHPAKIAVMVLGGARYGEAAAMELLDILWDKHTIYLQRSWSDKANMVKVLKSDVCRYIPLTDTLADIMREHLADFPTPNALVFPGPVGNVQRHSSFLEHVWQPLMEKTGLTYRKIHTAWHTFATTALEGDPENGIQPEIGSGCATGWDTPRSKRRNGTRTSTAWARRIR